MTGHDVQIVDGQRVRFFPKGYRKDHIDFIECQIKDGVLEIYASGQLVITPRVTNTLMLDVLER